MEKELVMKGSIRFIVGLLIVFGAVGSFDHALKTTTLMLLILAAAFGLGIMASGTKSLKTYQ